MTTKEKFILTAEDKTKQAFNSVKRNVESVNKSYSSLKTIAAGAIAATGIIALSVSFDNLSASVSNSLGVLDDLGKTSRRLSLPIKELQEYHALSEASGISTKTFDVAFQRFARRVGEAKQGTGELKKAIDQLNISFTDENGNLRSNASLFDEFGQKVGSLEDDNVALSLAMKGVDTEGVKLIEMFRIQASEQDKVISKLNELGGVYDEQLIAQAEEYRTEIGLVVQAQERLDVVSDASLSKVALWWEKIKLDAKSARNEMEVTFGLINPTLEKQLELINKKLKRTYAVGGFRVELEKEKKALEEKIKLQEKELEGQRDLQANLDRIFASVKPQKLTLDGDTGITKSMTVDMQMLAYSINDGKKALEKFKPYQHQTIESTSTLTDNFKLLSDSINNYRKNVSTLGSGKMSVDMQMLAYSVNDYRDNLKDSTKELTEWQSFGQQSIGGISDAFVDMAATGKSSFEDFARSFLLNIAKMIAQTAILNAVKGSTIGGFLGLSDGGVADKGKITAYANGDVFNSPTMFNHSGGLGVLGEAGPEAIMPLKRGADGKLGVQASGSGGQNVTINQSITVSGNGDKTLISAMQQAAAQGAQQGYALVLGDFQRNGSIRGTI